MSLPVFYEFLEMYRSISLLDWYKIELVRVSAFLNEINYTSDEESKNKPDEDSLINIILDMFTKFFEKGKTTSNDLIMADMKRTFYDLSLNFNDYCRKWLKGQYADYAQGQHDGGLPFLAIIYFYHMRRKTTSFRSWI